ncbi:MAG TPA: ubiquinone/menaquinone biosynthesis methyltransferase [Thermoplasmata archaeon]|nr:ubiquinone/menaquinone biosynthesis methyltransferase [Thermoplasmata archaeon]
MGPPNRGGPSAADGSPLPDRSLPTFERDVRRMFTHIAHGYEWFDHVASLGNDLLWRPRALWDLDRFRAPGPVHLVLDIGCGTGELARLAARHYGSARVVGADFTRAMLENAARSSDDRPERSRLEFARATALRLPFPDGTFDLVTNAFVARNLSDLGAAFREVRRVLRPGGVFLTLEITEPASPTVNRLFHAYFDRVVPWLGGAVGSAGPYRYLPRSLKSLPDRVSFGVLLGQCGFPRVVTRPQSAGIVTTFLAEAGTGFHQSR